MAWLALKETLSYIKRPTVSRGSLLLALALVAIFSSALIMRVMPARYGYYLNEFDPYFDYRAAQFLVENYDRYGLQGLMNYFTWVDRQAWYPEGRNVAATSQSGLHFAGALLYLFTRNILAIQTSLYDFLVFFPALFGALTTVVIFVLVRRMFGTTAGLLSSLIITVAPAIIQRGNLGWFKSEPLALFLALLGLYFFITPLSTRASDKGAIWRACLAGFLLGYSNTSWGGAQFFSIVVGLFLFVTPFLNLDAKRLALVSSLTIAFDLIFSSLLPRPGPSFILGPAGILMAGGFTFSILAYVLRFSSGPRGAGGVVGGVVLVALAAFMVLSFGLVSGVSERYLTVLYPYQRTTNPLVESVAEHLVPTGSDYFTSNALLLFLAVFGVFVAFRKRDHNSALLLVLSITAIYFASSFSRLMVFSSIAFSLLGGLGFAELTSGLLKPGLSLMARRKMKIAHVARGELKLVYAVLMIIMFMIPLTFPAGSHWGAVADTPPSITNGGIPYKASLGDWREALEWIRNSTPKGSVVASWWDYGYWITVLGNRTSLADNATANTTRIALLGRMLMSPEEDAVNILKLLKGDAPKLYVLIFIAGQKVEAAPGQQLYILGAGGDESKAIWFIKIGGLAVSRFLNDDDSTPKPAFWDTLLGNMIPLKLAYFVDRQTGQPSGTDYVRGNIAAYTRSQKYLDPSGPLKLVFESSSLRDPPKGRTPEIFAGVLIYELVAQR